MRNRRSALAAAIGVVAAALALGLDAAGFAPLDAAVYARWRHPTPPSGSVLVVSEDSTAAAAADGALGRLVSRLSRAGAAAIVLDSVPPARRAGAADEALLRQTVAQAGNVVVALAPEANGDWARAARSVGHIAGSRADGIAAIPAFTAYAERRVPALGLAAAAVALNAEPVTERNVVTLGSRRIAVDAAGRTLLSPSDRLPAIDVSGSDGERLASLVGGKIVVVPREPARAAAMRLQAELADAVLTGSTLAMTPPLATWGLTLGLGIAAAWLWLARRWWVALALSVGIALAVAAVTALLLRAALLAPLAAPLITLVAASVGALGWRQIDARRRLAGLEAEVQALQEALARQESTVETLEEDLEAARAAVERSAGAARAADALRAQLDEARRAEAETRRRLDALAGESRAVVETTSPDEACARVGIVTRDPALLSLFGDLEKAARASLPILIEGEPGTGKELFARAAHRLSGRAGQPFVAVNMAAISPELFESELFGHVRGSFTGAVADRKGWFEQADRGTIFLDEVGELRAEHQGKLLRVLQEKTFHRVGATRPTAVDVRIVAATNRDLARGVTEGWFREDLYFRLKGLVLRLPPLRARRADIPLLAAQILNDAAAEVKRPGLALSEAALAALERHDWPGNVRELQNCLRQAAALAERDVLGPADLRLPPASAVEAEPRDPDGAVLSALRRHRFDMQATARALGWDRSTVTQHLKGLGFRALVEAQGDAARAARDLAGDPALVRTVEVKLREYHDHLIRTVDSFDSLATAIAACRRRFKNLPERHFRALESLLSFHFARPKA